MKIVYHGMRMQKSTRHILLDALFPRSCLSCDSLISPAFPNTYICGPCGNLVLFNTVSRCAFCRNPVSLWSICLSCKAHHALDGLLVAADYEDPVIERMVKALKYRFVKIVARDIGKMMAVYLEQRASLLRIRPTDIIITAIPLHPKRLRWRGFNQAELIAKNISAKLGLTYQNDILSRTVYKKPQADIKDRDERIKNAENIFDLAVGPLTTDRPLASKTVILVDDVATTGSTLDNAARVLKSDGAQKVIGFVFARG